MIQIAFVRFVRLEAEYWFEGYWPKPHGETNNVLQNLRRSNNVNP